MHPLAHTVVFSCLKSNYSGAERLFPIHAVYFDGTKVYSLPTLLLSRPIGDKPSVGPTLSLFLLACRQEKTHLRASEEDFFGSIHLWGSLGNVLLSQNPAVQVPLALEGLTVVFEMGTRGSPPPSLPNEVLRGPSDMLSDGLSAHLAALRLYAESVTHLHELSLSKLTTSE